MAVNDRVDVNGWPASTDTDMALFAESACSELLAEPRSKLPEVVPFKQAMKALLRRMRPTLPEALMSLQKARLTAASVRLLQEYHPAALGGKISGLLGYSRNELHPLDEEAFKLLSELFPCNVDFMEEEMLNSEDGSFCIQIEPQFNIGHDLFEEFVLDPENWGNGPLTSLLVLVSYLDAAIAAEYFLKADQHFGWQLDDAPVLSYRDGELDTKAFYRRLKRANLEEYRLPFEMIGQRTGNPFLDWTEDDLNDIYIAYNLENVRKLVGQWDQAQPKVEALQRAAERAWQERWIYGKIVALWDRSTKLDRSTKPLTLAQIFQAEEEAGEA
jgi:hypothetical protein